jgi:hypothetical protein
MTKTNSVANAKTQAPSQIEKFSTLDDWANEGIIAPEVLKLEEGERIRGILEGPGQFIATTDAAGDPKDVPTWRIRTAQACFDLMGGHNLDKNLPELVGHEVGIAFMGQGTTKKGNRVNEFKIVDFGKKSKS